MTRSTIIPHASHVMREIDGEVCCAVCYAAPWMPIAEQQCYVLKPPYINSDGCGTWWVSTQEDAERWGYRIVGGPEQVEPKSRDAEQPETWHDRLVRLARELDAASKANDAARDAAQAAEEARGVAYKAFVEAEAAFNEATMCSAILAAGGGK